MAIDCIPHASGHLVPHIHHVVRHHHYPKPLTPIVMKTATKPRVVLHHVRLRECPPGAVVAPLADLDNDNVAAIYMLLYASTPAGDEAVIGDAAAVTGAPDATPAEASGLDLPTGGLGDIGSMGGGSGGSSGPPSGSGGGDVGSGGSGGASSGGGGGGSGSASGAGGSNGGAGASSPGGSTGAGQGGTGDGGGISPVVVVTPLPTGGSGNSITSIAIPITPTGGGGGTVSGVPEPSGWALMLIGFGTAGAALRKTRRTREHLILCKSATPCFGEAIWVAPIQIA